jgi:cysteinyl-tRNA synthetase
VKDFEAAMDDDFNTPQAVAVIFDFVKEVNKILDQSSLSKSKLIELKNFLKKTADDVLGIISFEELESSNKSIEDDLIKLIIDLRDQLKKEKNYQLADKIRNSLNELGIILRDGQSGTSYKKKV